MEALLQDKNLKRICILIILSLWAWSVFGGTVAPGDSVGVKKIEGRSFIVYQIGKGETAYAVSRKYGVPFKEIAAANTGVDMGALKTGQEILVPVIIFGTSTSVIAGTQESGQVPKEEVKEETVVHEEMPATTVAEEPMNTSEATSQSGETVVTEDVLPSPDMSTETSEKTKSFAMLYAEYQSTDMIASFEKGAATWIENNGIETSGDRFYALNNSAPIGSIIKVRNMMNNRIVYAKVIGRLSETEVNAKVLVKLSAGAGERLNVLDNRFVVEITYYQSAEEKASD